MSSDLIQAWSSLVAAIAWPVTALIIVFFVPRIVMPMVKKGSRVHLTWSDIEVTVEPTEGLRPPSDAPEAERKQLTKEVAKVTDSAEGALPLDYFFLNHTSFLRKDKQEEFRQRTGVPLDHYDIRVIVDSYYRGALDRVEQVEYILHRAYPQPIQYCRNREEKFLLKELANGEYVLMAKVFLKDRKEPVLLQRYITLWDSGPRLP